MFPAAAEVNVMVVYVAHLTIYEIGVRFIYPSVVSIGLIQVALVGDGKGDVKSNMLTHVG